MAPEQLNLNMFEGENDSAGKPADVHSFAMAAYQVRFSTGGKVTARYYPINRSSQGSNHTLETPKMVH